MEDDNKQFNKAYFERIVDKLIKLDDSVRNIDRTLIKQEANLEKHMLRTEQNETMIKLIVEDIKPIKKHINQVDGVIKFFGLVAFLVSLTGGILKIFNII